MKKAQREEGRSKSSAEWLAEVGGGGACASWLVVGVEGSEVGSGSGLG